ncbi:cell division cycle protein 23 homolog isoform X2 [Ischnura elegans]|uniref:cell division cycle protein 23 homolog isoform X2 n=1 Tax=Ischnura elegans TaxID=197161 RepID=UPI001ED87DEE|nr:cell division cycle protein 23 homolog isoform X2 [Ischnura elegans]
MKWGYYNIPVHTLRKILVMDEGSLFFDLKAVKGDLLRGIHKCSQRGLMNSAKWLAELNYALNDVKLDNVKLNYDQDKVSSESDSYLLAKSYFDLKEYDRCAFFTESCRVPKTRFLHLYSRYLASEKKRINNMTEKTLSAVMEPSEMGPLRELASDLRRERSEGSLGSSSLDGFGLYLLGIVAKRLDLLAEAEEALVAAVNAEPTHWGAWLELASLVTDRSKLVDLKLPSHWIKHFFLGHVYLEIQLNAEALSTYWSLSHAGFGKSNYITAQTAIAHHNQRDVDQAIALFQKLQKCDPYRLDNLDTYSNLLYVKELKVELANLAHHATQIDEYRAETCCVIGNLYSLRAEHQKAVLYFTRALKLNPYFLSAWTLMGHEFMEMKNTNAAIRSYRQAIEVNRRDYRAWYGLGQTYEILKMPAYCLYYYHRAQALKPMDSRMLVALGETYEKLERMRQALGCYKKARGVGDIEGGALLKMAKIYEKLKELDHAAESYKEYVQENEPRTEDGSVVIGSGSIVATTPIVSSASPRIGGGGGDRIEMAQAYKFLANYFIRRDNLDEAYVYSQRCLEYDETKEEGKALLRTIAQKRSLQEEGSMQVEEPNCSSGELYLAAPNLDWQEKKHRHL